MTSIFSAPAEPIKLRCAVEQTDAALMLRFKAGEAAAFDELYERHRGALYRYFLRQAPRALVDDLFQDTWLRLVKASGEYEPSAPFAAYLFRIAHNILVDHYRRVGRAPELAPDAALVALVDPAPQPSESYAFERLRERFVEALESLPAAQREAFLLHQEAGLTLEQIAAVVGSNREAIKSRLRYAAARLRKALAAERRAEVKQA